MSIRLVRLRDLEPSDKSTLEERLTKFYQTTPALYYQIADQAANEMARARSQMEILHGEVVALRERLRRLDRQDLDTLLEIVDGLEGLLHEDGSKKH